MGFEAPQTGRRLYFRRAYARAGRQDHSRTPHQIQWRKRRTRSAAGMPLYGMQPPTGYPMKADAWVNSSALLGRMNFALALTSDKLRGAQADANRTGNLPSDPQAALATLENTCSKAMFRRRRMSQSPATCK